MNKFEEKNVGGRRPAGPPRRPGAGPKKPEGGPQAKKRIDKARELQKKSGIPFAQALRVVDGQITLDSVLKAMMWREQANSLQELYGLSASAAGQVVRGHVPLDKVLLRKRRKEHPLWRGDYSIIEQAKEGGYPIVLEIHGRESRTVKVLENLKYDYVVEGNKEPQQKLFVKLGYRAEVEAEAKKALRFDKKILNKKMTPVRLPSERVKFDETAILDAADKGKELKITTLEGDQVKGKLAWIGKYEMGITVAPGVEIAVFRHAMYKMG